MGATYLPSHARRLTRIPTPFVAAFVGAVLVSCSGADGPFAPPGDGARRDASVIVGPLDSCGNGIDDDGDGRIDEDCYCARGETQGCFTGSHATRGVGMCSDGVQVCETSGEEFGRWGPCDGDRTASAQLCDGRDGDCDGAIDENCPCTRGDSHACGLEFILAPCTAGVQSCRTDGTWSGCEGAIAPEPEVCDDGVDNNCDGEADEGCGCIPGPETCSDGIDNDCDGEVDEEGCGGGIPREADAAVDPACPPPPGMLWARTIEVGSSTTPRFPSNGTLLATDSAHNLYVVIMLENREFTMDGVTLPPVSDGDLEWAILSFDPTGILRWGRRFERKVRRDGACCHPVEHRFLAVDGENLFLTGYTQGAPDLGGGRMPQPQARGIFLASYSTLDGAHRWSRWLDGPGNDYSALMALEDGHIYLTAHSNGGIDVGTGLLPAGVIVLSLSDDGVTTEWAHSFEFGGGALGDSPTVAASADGTTLMVAIWVPPLTFPSWVEVPAFGRFDTPAGDFGRAVVVTLDRNRGTIEDARPQTIGHSLIASIPGRTDEYVFSAGPDISGMGFVLDSDRMITASLTPLEASRGWIPWNGLAATRNGVVTASELRIPTAAGALEQDPWGIPFESGPVAPLLSAGMPVALYTMNTSLERENTVVLRSPDGAGSALKMGDVVANEEYIDLFTGLVGHAPYPCTATGDYYLARFRRHW